MTTIRFALALAVSAAGLVAPAQLRADQAGCHKQVVKQLLKLEKIHVKVASKCFDLENALTYPGPCLDPTGQAKLDTIRTKVAFKVGNACTPADLAALGFSTSCADYGSAATSAGAACAALPAGTVDEFVECIGCWKAAELQRYVAVLYASHAVEACDGSLDATSPVCQPVGCTTPLPDQRNLGTSGNDTSCQKGIGKAGLKYLVLRAKALGSCGLTGATRADCLADATVQQKLAAAETRKSNVIRNKCGGNLDPVPSPVFCCRTGGNTCVAAATREDCTTGGGEVQEDKFCDVDSTCQSLGGNKQFTWWGSCPDDASCPGTSLDTTDDLIACVDSVADVVVDRLLCLQIPRNGGADWPCPSSPSGAFVD